MFGGVYLMLILGIDPGIAILGFGLVKYEANRFTVIDYGAITTDSGIPMSSRLTIIYNGLVNIIEK